VDVVIKMAKKRSSKYKACVMSHKNLSIRTLRGRAAEWCNMMDAIGCLKANGGYNTSKKCDRSLRAAKRYFRWKNNVVRQGL